MSFGIGTNTQVTNAGEIKGERKAIACQCWFTSTGNCIPLMIKFEDEDGVIQSVRDIMILYAQKKYYAGIQTMEYACQLKYCGQVREVKLIFLQEECKWVMVL